MFAHTCIYRFPESVSEQDREKFFNALSGRIRDTGLVRTFDRKPNLHVGSGSGHPGTVITRLICDSLDDLRKFCELDEVDGLTSGWAARLGFDVASATHEELGFEPVHGLRLEHAEHSLTAEAPIEVAWQVLVDVLRYPEIFPPTEEVTMLEERPGYQLARFRVEVAGESHTWVSRRDIDHALRVISYEQVERSPLVGHMGGQWRAFALSGARTQLVLTHDFAVSEPVDGLVAGRLTSDEADTMLKGVVERNSVADLSAVKTESERVFAGRSGHS